MIVLITEPNDYSNDALLIYENFGKLYLGRQKKNIESLVEVLVVRLGINLNQSVLHEFPNLKYIISPTTGLSHVDLNYCISRRIKVLSLADVMDRITGITATSELTIALILSLVRKIPWAYNSVIYDKVWDRDLFKGRQLSSLTLGIVGVGRVGSHLALYAKQFGMKILGYDPNKNTQHFLDLGIERVESLDALLPKVDVLSINASANLVNEKLIGVEQIQKMQPNSLIINTARGSLLDELAIYDALRSNRLGGVAVDVLFDEHSSGIHWTKSPLMLAAEEGCNVIITPHIGGCTLDSMQATEKIIAEYAQSRIITGVPNVRG
jgi:D-3-phosphoglycerate dehydrogenase